MCTHSIETEGSNRVLLLVYDADGAVQVVVVRALRDAAAARLRAVRLRRHRLRAAPREHRSYEHLLPNILINDNVINISIVITVN